MNDLFILSTCGIISSCPSYAINDCYFYIGSAVSRSGGAISVDCVSQLFICTNSMFYKCITGNYRGGAINVYSTGSSSGVTMNNNCAYHCYVGGPLSGQFAFIEVPSTVSLSMQYNSINRCAPSSNSGYSPLYLKGASQSIKNMNSSYNTVTIISGPYFYSSNPSSCRYSTFYHNVCANEECIRFYGGSHSMMYSNIVSNNSPNKFGVVSNQNSAAASMTKCIFISNSDFLFHRSSGTLTINQCWISHSSSLSSGTVTISDKDGETSTYQIVHFYTHFCLNPYPPTLDITPLPTLEETPMATYKNTKDTKFHRLHMFLHSPFLL